MVELVDAGDVFGSTVFCDDIRQEITGKFIYIGVYQGAMVFHVPFPARLPRIAFAISVAQKIDAVTPIMNFKIFLPGDGDENPSFEAEVLEQTPGAFSEAAANNANVAGIPLDDRKYLVNSSVLTFDGVEIKQPGLIKVRVDIGGKRYRLGSLSVTAGPKPKS